MPSSSKKALLIIDMQHGLFFAPQQPFAAETLLNNINTLIARARDAKAPIFAARHTGPEGTPLAESSPLTQLIPQLAIDAELDGVFVKRYPNCFRGTTLLASLQLAGIEELVICGMKTEYCVDTTCRAAADLGFRVVLISDAHSTTDNGQMSASQIIAHHNQTISGPFAQLAATADALI
ncbi:cysteine hydrolase family protein [Enterobacter cancerogenus]|uniref:cysteine hydrolase family protein n=1 Tax=Enterobacter cancerogenus TaxID=69218 RepID=UPI00053703E0|nr:cysteine hydrolase family protein [Enterobacter cancerogenus]KGT91234.1 isochorismatase [Enterobacter cancerogenus]